MWVGGRVGGWGGWWRVPPVLIRNPMYPDVVSLVDFEIWVWWWLALHEWMDCVHATHVYSVCVYVCVGAHASAGLTACFDGPCALWCVLVVAPWCCGCLLTAP